MAVEIMKRLGETNKHKFVCIMDFIFEVSRLHSSYFSWINIQPEVHQDCPPQSQQVCHQDSVMYAADIKHGAE
jgi:hypothetical protein